MTLHNKTGKQTDVQGAQTTNVHGAQMEDDNNCKIDGNNGQVHENIK